MDYTQFADFLLVVMYRVTWLNVFLSIGAAFLLYLLVKLQRGNSKFDVSDLFLDPKSGKASSSQLIILVMAGLSVWAVVTLIEKDKSVDTILLGVLGIFVLGKTATAVWGPNDTPPPPPPDDPHCRHD